MIVPADLRVRRGWWGALVAATLNVAGMGFEAVFARQFPDMPQWPPRLSISVGAAVLAVLVVRRRTPTALLSSIAFVVNIAGILVALWITSAHYAAADAGWIPFQANKLGVMAAALLAPDLLSGALGVVCFSGMVLLRYYTLEPVLQGRLAVGEPWTILYYALFGGVLLIYRLRELDLRCRSLRLDAETVVIRRFARTFRAVRDYANTPIQTIELVSALIRARHPALDPLLKRIDRSVERLRTLSRVFTRYERDLGWSPDELSFDPYALIVIAGGGTPSGRSRRRRFSRARRR